MTRGVLVRAALLACLGTSLAPAAAADEAPSSPVRLGGVGIESVEGGTDAGEPTELDPGRWTDTLSGAGSAGDTRHYSYLRAMGDSTVHLGVTAAPTQPSDTVDLTVTLPDGTDCTSESTSSSTTAPVKPIGIAVSVGPGEEGDRSAACLTAPELRIAVSRGTSSVTEPLPVALQVVEEAPVLDAAGLPEADDSDAEVEEPDAGDPDAAGGSASFRDAPALEASATVDVRVREGQLRMFRVPVEYGQRLAVAARVPAMDAETAEAAGLFGPDVVVSLGDTRGAVTDGDSTTYGEEAGTALAGTLEVRHRNRFSVSEFSSLAGWFWVVVSVEAAPEDRDPLDVPVELTVLADGEPNGAPEYPENVSGVAGGAAPDGYDADAPFLVGAGRWGVSPSDAVFGERGWFGPRRVAGAVVGLLSLGSGAAGLWLLLRRRRVLAG